MVHVASKAPALLMFLLGAGAVQAFDLGPTVPTLEWRAKVRLGAHETSSLAPLASRPSYALAGGLVMGDYYFNLDRWGLASGLRASGGVLFRGTSALSELALPGELVVAPTNTRLATGPINLASSTEGQANTQPYFGLGYTRLGLWGGWGITADVGVVATQGGAALVNGRALSNARNLDDAVRDIRLRPLVQMGARYTF